MVCGFNILFTVTIFNKLIYFFWLCWVFISAWAFLGWVSRELPSCCGTQPSVVVASFAVELQTPGHPVLWSRGRELSSHGFWAPGQGLSHGAHRLGCPTPHGSQNQGWKPRLQHWQSGFFTSEPPGKPCYYNLSQNIFSRSVVLNHNT